MKRITLALMLIVCTLLLASCGNMDSFNTVFTFHEAIISMPDGTVLRGKVQKWTDYQDGDQIQVKIDDVVYLVHSENIVLMNIGK